MGPPDVTSLPERVGEAACCAPISPGPWGWVAARLRPALIRANRVPRAAAVMSRALSGAVNRALGRSLIALSSGVGWRDDQRCRPIMFLRARQFRRHQSALAGLAPWPPRPPRRP